MEIKVNNTFFTGKFLLHLPSVDSTNNYAKNYIANNSPIDGTVILADEQLAGRGQAGNVWQSDANKNLTFSIIYKTSFLKATEQFYLNMAVSLGIWEMVNGQWPIGNIQKPKVKIKWPNDIYVNDRKIAGILIENTISGMNLKHSVLGIGLNVNQVVFQEHVYATSLKLEKGIELDISKAINDLLMSVEKFFFILKERKFERLKNEYLQNLYRFNIQAAFKCNNEVIKGKILNVDETGNLEIETLNGTGYFGFKEIEFII